VKYVAAQHTHLWLTITESSVLEAAKTQLAISYEYTTAATTWELTASTTTQRPQHAKAGWSDHGKSLKMFPSHAQTVQSFCYKMMVRSASSWKVSDKWKSKSRAGSAMIQSSSL
jgi:hypothetical protein